ncbi:MAG: glycosyltransferase [Candidatus Omnitrophica bacterium]|nr:glycosyltransferase [Candidatus Omnitrophota bacterium]MDD5552966.1 glycosyltransferase [Candidatus Omnitrophota bacterium]
MNILLSMLKFPPDFTGAGLRTAALYSNLQKNGRIGKVLVLTSSQGGRTNPIYRVNGLDVFSVNGNIYPAPESTLFSRVKKTFYVLRSSLRISRQYMRCHREFDIIHTVDSSWLSTLVAWLAFFTGRPLVKEIVLLGCDDPASIKKSKGPLSRYLYLFPFRYAKLIIVISPPLKEACVKCGISAKKIWCRHNPVYFLNGAEVLNGKDNIELEFSKPTILWVGAFGKRKNVEFLLEAARFLRGSLQLLFIGPVTDEGYFLGIRKRANELMSQNKEMSVGFPGMISDRRYLRSVYEKSRLFWFSSHNEGLGNVVIESLLCGTPVVALPVNGVMDSLISQPRDGRIVDTDDPRVFAQAVNFCLSQNYNRAEIELNAKKRFDPLKIEDGYAERFDSIRREKRR